MKINLTRGRWLVIETVIILVIAALIYSVIAVFIAHDVQNNAESIDHTKFEALPPQLDEVVPAWEKQTIAVGEAKRGSSDIHIVQNVSQPIVQTKIDESSSYLTLELEKLVRAWEKSTITAEEAKHEIWKIVRSKSYIEHRPNRGIVFIKTHKTGSSTVNSILHSVAISHNLTTPVTLIIHHDARPIEQRKILMERMTSIPGVTGAPYDIWCNHVVFHESLLTEAVPTSEGKYFSIVRDPATRMRSACAFYKCCPANSTEQYATYVLSKFKGRKRKKENMWDKYCRLDQSFSVISGTMDRHNSTQSPETLKAVQARVYSGELLLLVTERFTESMLVLRDFYNLHPLDVAYSAKKSNKNFANVKVNETKLDMIERAYDLMRDWNPFDFSIYNLANDLLTRKLEDLYPLASTKNRVKEEAELLNDILYHVCSHDLYNFTSQLNLWCLERELDNYEWNKMHFKQQLNLKSEPKNKFQFRRFEDRYLKSQRALHQKSKNY